MQFCKRRDSRRQVTETKFEGVYVVEPQVFGDARGWFMESWSQRKLAAAGIDVAFVQDNQSYSAENKKQLFIPRGFAHGFITLTDDVEVQYKADNYYAPECDGNIRWDDLDIAVAWPIAPTILSAKDAQAPTLRERAAASLNFVYEGGKGLRRAAKSCRTRQVRYDTGLERGGRIFSGERPSESAVP